MRAIAVTTLETQFQRRPDLPTIGETLNGFEASGMARPVRARPGRRGPVVDKIAAEVKRVFGVCPRS